MGKVDKVKYVIRALNNNEFQVFDIEEKRGIARAVIFSDACRIVDALNAVEKLPQLLSEAYPK